MHVSGGRRKIERNGIRRAVERERERARERKRERERVGQAGVL